jgi:hypothetical protein
MSKLTFILRGSWAYSPSWLGPPVWYAETQWSKPRLSMGPSCSSTVSLAAGLAMILGHNVWSGGTLPVVVTLVGWLILAKGLLLFFVTPEALTQLLERMQYGEHYSLYIAPSLVIGLYLTWAGFTAPHANAD